MISRDRGRGRGQYPNRGQGRGNFPPLPYHSKNGSNTASSSSSSINQNDPLYGEFMEFIKEKKGETSNTGNSYASTVITEEPDDSKDYYRNPHQEIIMLVEEKDIMRYFDANNDDWLLMSRYLDTASYPAGSYKHRSYYENILKATESCDISHFYPANSNQVYNFSKIIIKTIISAEDWGISTLKEKEFIHPEQRISVKFNY